MLFNSFHFFVFLIFVLLACAVLRKFSKSAEIWFLIAASAYFYGQWSWTYLILIYITIVADYLIGIKCYTSSNPKKFLILSLMINLGILGFFKYFNFFLGSTNEVIALFSSDYRFQILNILLPVGISFYTFQSLSYTIDIYRKELKPRSKISEYALFVSFFPQLVAGPIVRASEFFEQLNDKRCFSFTMAQSGMFLIMIGLVKKVVFADNLALIADPVFDNPENYSAIGTLIGIYAFAFQIYFDFSGYTDIAIGVASLLGFAFPKNFNHPYIALSVQDFWRRWHITLSRWLRDYLYISLGGNRKGSLFTARNLFLTMFLGGLWHGASWNFAIWGVLHGVYLAIERWAVRINPLNFIPIPVIVKFLKWLLTFNLVCFAWIFFRAENFSDSSQIISNLMQWQDSTKLIQKNSIAFVMILLLPIIHFITAKLSLADRSGVMQDREYIFWQCCFIIILILFSANNSDSFMYFQF